MSRTFVIWPTQYTQIVHAGKWKCVEKKGLQSTSSRFVKEKKEKVNYVTSRDSAARSCGILSYQAVYLLKKGLLLTPTHRLHLRKCGGKYNSYSNTINESRWLKLSFGQRIYHTQKSCLANWFIFGTGAYWTVMAVIDLTIKETLQPRKSFSREFRILFLCQRLIWGSDVWVDSTQTSTTLYPLLPRKLH